MTKRIFYLKQIISILIGLLIAIIGSNGWMAFYLYISTTYFISYMICTRIWKYDIDAL